MNIEERKEMLNSLKVEKINNLVIPGAKVLVRAFLLEEDNKGFQLKEKKEQPNYQNRGEVLALGNSLPDTLKGLEVGDIVDFRPEGFMSLVILEKNNPRPATLENLDPLFLIDEILIDWYTKKENNV